MKASIPAETEREMTNDMAVINASRASRLKVHDEKTCKAAADFLVTIANVKKGFEEKRQFFVRPLQKHINDINAFFRGYTGQLGKIDLELREKVIAYKDKEAEAAAEALKKAESPLDFAPPEKSVRTGDGRVTSVVSWEFEVINQALVPGAYLKVDETAVREAVNSGVREIPGLKIFKSTRLSVFAK